MKKLIAPALVLMSFSAFADTDYSRCNQSIIMSGLSVNNDGKVSASPFYDIQDIKTEGKKETYTVKLKGGGIGLAGGSSNPVKVTVERDDQGRVVQVISGELKPDEKYIKEYKSGMSKMMGAMSSGTYEPSVYFDPNAGERADGGSPRLIPVSQLSKKSLITMGIDLSPEDLKKMQKQWKKDKKTQKKLADAYEKIYKAPQFIPMGTTSSFEFVDGACVPSLVTSNSYYEKTKTVSTATIYSKNDCDDVERVYLKHQKKISECQSYESKEMSNDWQTIYSPTGSMGFGGYGMPTGMGLYGGYGYGGFGGGSAMSQLAQRKMNCDMYKNGGGFGIAGGSGSGASTSNTNKSQTSNQ